MKFFAWFFVYSLHCVHVHEVYLKTDYYILLVQYINVITVLWCLVSRPGGAVDVLNG